MHDDNNITTEVFLQVGSGSLSHRLLRLSKKINTS